MIGKNKGIVRNNVITENFLSGETIHRGAGVILALVDSSLVFENNRISNNYFVDGECWGGGIYTHWCNPRLVNNIISENSASIGGGLFIYTNEDAPLQIINNTITENYADMYSGGLYAQDANVFVMNSIFWDNDAPEDPEIYVWDSELTVVYSDIDGDWAGEGNIDEDPEFEDDTLFHISETSDCINSGIDIIEIDGVEYCCPLIDIDNEPRPDTCAAVPDIGADELMYSCVGIKESQFQFSIFNFQVYPNPSFGISQINYNVTDDHRVLGAGCLLLAVDLVVYDMMGNKVKTLVNKKQLAGEYTVWFDGSDLPAGIYFIRLQVGEEITSTNFIRL